MNAYAEAVAELARAQEKVKAEREKLYKEFFNSVKPGTLGIHQGKDLVIFQLIRKGRYDYQVAFPIYTLDAGDIGYRREKDLSTFIDINVSNFDQFETIDDPKVVVKLIQQRAEKEVEKAKNRFVANWN